AATFAATLVGGIEAIADEVEEHPHHVLRHDFDPREIWVEAPLHHDVEALVLSAGAVIGEVERLFDEGVEKVSHWKQIPVSLGRNRLRGAMRRRSSYRLGRSTRRDGHLPRLSADTAIL